MLSVQERHYLEHVVLRCELEIFVSDGEGDIWHGGNFLAIYHSLTGGQERQSIADVLQVLLYLLLCLVIGNGDLKALKQSMSYQHLVSFSSFTAM